jgi:hypothetical protein
MIDKLSKDEQKRSDMADREGNQPEWRWRRKKP